MKKFIYSITFIPFLCFLSFSNLGAAKEVLCDNLSSKSYFGSLKKVSKSLGYMAPTFPIKSISTVLDDTLYFEIGKNQEPELLKILDENGDPLQVYNDHIMDNIQKISFLLTDSLPLDKKARLIVTSKDNQELFRIRQENGLLTFYIHWALGYQFHFSRDIRQHLLNSISLFAKTSLKSMQNNTPEKAQEEALAGWFEILKNNMDEFEVFTWLFNEDVEFADNLIELMFDKEMFQHFLENIYGVEKDDSFNSGDISNEKRKFFDDSDRLLKRMHYNMIKYHKKDRLENIYLSLLEHPNFFIQRETLSLLKDVATLKSLSKLRGLINKDIHTHLRWDALRILGDLKADCLDDIIPLCIDQHVGDYAVGATLKITDNKNILKKAYLLALQNKDFWLREKAFKWLAANFPSTLFPLLDSLLGDNRPVVYEQITEFIENHFAQIKLEKHAEIIYHLTSQDYGTTKNQKLFPLLQLYFKRKFMPIHSYWLLLRPWMMEIHKWSFLDFFSGNDATKNPVFLEFSRLMSLNEEKLKQEQEISSKVIHFKGPELYKNSVNESYVYTFIDNMIFFTRWLDIKLPHQENLLLLSSNLFDFFVILSQFQILNYELNPERYEGDAFEENMQNTKQSLVAMKKLYKAFCQGYLKIYLTSPMGQSSQLTENDLFAPFESGASIHLDITNDAKLMLLRYNNLTEVHDISS